MRSWKPLTMACKPLIKISESLTLDYDHDPDIRASDLGLPPGLPGKALGLREPGLGLPRSDLSPPGLSLGPPGLDLDLLGPGLSLLVLAHAFPGPGSGLPGPGSGLPGPKKKFPMYECIGHCPLGATAPASPPIPL